MTMKCSRKLNLLVILLVILAVVRVRTVSASVPEKVQMINFSGNLNRRLSVDPIRRSESYSTVLYDIRNGLPTSEANAIAQTSEGFIWIGSYAGLIRYDGNTFERIDSTDGISSVRCLYVDSQDRLWIGTNDVGVVLMARNDIRRWNRSDGLRSVSIRVITEDADGLMYIGTTDGIAMIDDSMELTVLEDERLAGLGIRELRNGVDGLIYGLTQPGDIFTLKNGSLHSFLSHEECRVKGVLSILPDPRHPGELYLGTEDSRICQGSLEQNFSSLGIKDATPLTSLESMEYIDGDIWICAVNGIGKIDSLGFHTLLNVPMSNSVGHVMTDDDGNLWFTSSRQGIMKIVPNLFTDLFARYGLSDRVVNTTCMYGYQLFIGTDDGLIVAEDRKSIESVPLTEAVTASGADLGTDDLVSFLQGVRIRSIIRDSKGRLWISTWRRHGLLRYDQGKLMSFTQETGLFSDQIRVVSECEDGSILVAHNGGVSIIRDDKVVASYGEADGITNSQLLTVTEGFHHEIVLGSDAGGIYVLDGGKTTHIGVEDGLSSEVILRIKRSARHDIYWVVTSNSLAFMTPDFKVTTIRRFPYANNYDLYENSRGDVWVLSSSGLYVISDEKLLANEEIEPVFFGISSGLPFIVTANSYSEQTEDGDLYIAGSTGVIKVNMEKPFDDVSDMKISLPYIDADGTRIYPDSEGTFTVPGMARKLTIHPYVFNYSLIDPQVSYALEGFDLKETTISRSRLMPVDYTNLGIGSFTFTVTVKDPIGLNGHSAAFQINKGKEITVGTVGSMIMVFTSILLMGGMMVYTYPYRNRKKLEDTILSGLFYTNMALAAGELLSYVLEYMSAPFSRELMILGNTVYYIAYVGFPYLLWLYFDHRGNPLNALSRKRILLFGIPCFLFIAGVLVNIKTGWLFSIGKDYAFRYNLQGRLADLPSLIVWMYLLFSMIRVYRLNKRMLIAGVLLLAGRYAGEVFCWSISSVPLIYALFLVCIHLYLMYQPMKEVTL